MKKIILLLLFLVYVTIIAYGQNSIPNGNFEQWEDCVYDCPFYWFTQSSNPKGFLGSCYYNVNAYMVEDSYDTIFASYAAQMITEIGPYDTCIGYYSNGNIFDCPTNYLAGGIPYNQKPTGISGYYKSNLASGDTAKIIASFKNGGVNIGTYIFSLTGIHNFYTFFSFDFSPTLPSNPDTVIFAASSSDLQKNIAVNGGMFQIDNISFTGVTSQPLQFNGYFNDYWNENVYRPLDWYARTNNRGDGVYLTSDKVAGNGALELKTVLDKTKNNNCTEARYSSVETGYCTGSHCKWVVGNSFSNSIDTLAFFYKYVPTVITDSAQLNLIFKNNGSEIMRLIKNLGASASYQYIELPFVIGSTPDTVIVQIQSSLSQNIALMYVGADLKIDEMHFKTQPLTTGISNYENVNTISIFPNPATNNLTINIHKKSTIEILNIEGQIIKTINNNGAEMVIDLTNFSNGVYILKAKTDKGVTIKKFIKE
jgi:hypothetical protein